MATPQPTTVDRVINVLQLVCLIAACIGFATYIGRRDQQIDHVIDGHTDNEERIRELTDALVSLSLITATNTEQIASIRRDLERMRP